MNIIKLSFSILIVLFYANLSHSQNLLFSSEFGAGKNQSRRGHFSLSYPKEYQNTIQRSLNSVNDFPTLNAIIPDFQVNENAGPFGTLQTGPSISTASNGNFVITWTDSRNGDDSDIYAQRYSSDGSALSANFKVNNDQGTVSQTNPSIASDNDGNFVITWTDSRNGNGDIYAQRYSNDITPLGTNFKVNNDQGSATSQYASSVSSDRSGNFIVSWTDSRNGNGDIYAQRYSNDSTPLGTNFKVNNDQGSSASQYASSVSSNGSGDFIVTWVDMRNGNADIFAQRYSDVGIKQGTNFKINDNQENVYHAYPAISAAINGDFVIIWQDWRTGNSDIFAQRYSSDGSAKGTNFKVNDDQGGSNPSVSADGSGDVVITWTDSRNVNWAIYAQRYSSNGNVLGDNFKINDDFGENHFYPAICLDSEDDFVITWQVSGEVFNDNDIYAQRFSNDGMSIGNNFVVNDDQGSVKQEHPSITSDSYGNFIVAWEDFRNGFADIFAQRYSMDGNKIGDNFKVNDNLERANHYFPVVSSDGSGNFVIIWIDERNGPSDIYAQHYSSDGIALGANFKVNDDQVNVTQAFPCISVNPSGNFVITWEDYRNVSKSDIYVQCYSKDGESIGNNFRVNDDFGNVYQSFPNVSMDALGNFVVAWEDHRLGNGDSDIYAQRYSSNGNVLGANFKVNDDLGNVSQYSPAVSLDPNGNFVITWYDYRIANGSADIYAQRYSSDGNTLGTNFKVNDDLGDFSQYFPSISSDDNGNFVISWEDKRNGNEDMDVYAQRYNNEGVPIGTNFIVTNTGKRNQFKPKVELWNGRIYSTWSDNRTGVSGYDIWANVLQFQEGHPVPVELSNFVVQFLDENIEITWTTQSESQNYGFEIERFNGKQWEKIGFVKGNGTSTEPQHYSFIDYSFENNLLTSEIIYRLKQIDLGGSIKYSKEVKIETNIPKVTTLYPNYPNPFNSSTTILYTIPKAGFVVLKIYNCLGKEILKLVDEYQEAGNYFYNFEANEHPTGIYFYNLYMNDDLVSTKEMMLLR
jgi:hypothetical protein